MAAVSPAPPMEPKRAIFNVTAFSWARSILRLMLVAGGHGVLNHAQEPKISCPPAAALKTVANLHFSRPLKRLHAALYNIFGSSQLTSATPLFLNNASGDIRHKQGSLVFAYAPSTPDSSRLNDPEHLSLCAALLPTWETLRVLVILFQATERANIGVQFLDDYEVAELADEPRLVFLACYYLDDWITGARMGCGDYWSRAEHRIAKRKSEEIGRMGFFSFSCRDEMTFPS
ncbi:hypothetical protein C8R45DRAFT_1150312 [Mycena sanguinolenta]|nr:hypothetical protein C8R45DRAFT_1150312 [Mycena sanguinolenta]